MDNSPQSPQRTNENLSTRYDGVCNQKENLRVSKNEIYNYRRVMRGLQRQFSRDLSLNVCDDEYEDDYENRPNKKLRF